MTQATIDAEIESQLPTSGGGDISAFDLRTVLHDMNTAIFRTEFPDVMTFDLHAIIEGMNVGARVTSGVPNTFIGFAAGNQTFTGLRNTGLGSYVMQFLTSGNFNVSMGDSALATLSTAQQNTAFGFAALFATNGDSNIGIGFEALAANTTGTSNIAIGVNVMSACLTGNGNIAIGFQTLNALTANFGFSGSHVCIGTQAMQSYTDTAATGIRNTAIGHFSLQGLHTGGNNTGCGFETNLFAGRHDGSQTVNGCTAVGALALCYNTDGSFNTAVGYFAMFGNARADNPTFGSNNMVQCTAVGANALLALGNGSNITAIGFNALADVTDGANGNTALGSNTGRGIITGTNNTILGAGVTGLTAGLSNNIIIADGAGNKVITADSTHAVAHPFGLAPFTKAGAFIAADFPSGTWMVGRDTTNLTTKIYYNNAGTLMAVALV